jgi:hypothetical protein
MGKGSEWIAANRASEDHGPGSREAHHVTSSPQEDCGVPACEMGLLRAVEAQFDAEQARRAVERSLENLRSVGSSVQLLRRDD